MRISSAGNVGIGTTDVGTGGSRALVFGNGSKPTSLGNVAGLYAKDVGGTTELYSFDDLGNETLQSPHAIDAPEWLYDSEDGLPVIIKEVQHFLGYVRYTNLTRQARLSGMTDDEKKMLKSGQRTCVYKESFADYQARTGEVLAQLDWDTEQANIKTQKDAEREGMIASQAKLTAAVAEKGAQIARAGGAEDKAAVEKDLAESQQALSSLKVPDVYQVKPMPARLQAALGQ